MVVAKAAKKFVVIAGKCLLRIMICLWYTNLNSKNCRLPKEIWFARCPVDKRCSYRGCAFGLQSCHERIEQQVIHQATDRQVAHGTVLTLHLNGIGIQTLNASIYRLFRRLALSLLITATLSLMLILARSLSHVPWVKKSNCWLALLRLACFAA